MKCLRCKIIIEVRKKTRIFPSNHGISFESFAIVEKATITQEECDELLKILDEWKV